MPVPDALSPREGGVLVCDVTEIVKLDIDTVDLLARVALVARRRGCSMRLRGASVELQALIELAGLAAVLPCAGDSVLESER